MTSNQHGPLIPWATLMIQWLKQRVAKSQDGANLKNSASVRIGVCNLTLWSWNR